MRKILYLNYIVNSIYGIGLSVTGVLVLLVGCRLRSLKRHLRRGPRAGHTRDADYLVNGMYL